MLFYEYLKSCREKFNLTQEELTNELYNSHDEFKALDMVTVSRWERGVTHPSTLRKKLILKLFQKYSHSTFACFDHLSVLEIERKICELGINNLFKKTKHHIVKFPVDIVEADQVKILNIKESEHYDNYINIISKLIYKLTDSTVHINPNNFKEWALCSSSLFLISVYQDQFFGFSFSIRLKKDIFEKIMNFEMSEKDIHKEHLASVDEKGCIYFLGFFAVSELSSSLLMLRNYANFIANERYILSYGRVTKTKEGIKLVTTIGLKKYKSFTENKNTQVSYRGVNSDVLLNETLLKIIFKK
ncbi:MAG: hypothetical protein GQ570_15725 [Helicobacteraceae bacterium]|nr:hypothetical protein [Helicobacteraceae bacterium]